MSDSTKKKTPSGKKKASTTKEAATSKKTTVSPMSKTSTSKAAIATSKEDAATTEPAKSTKNVSHTQAASSTKTSVNRPTVSSKKTKIPTTSASKKNESISEEATVPSKKSEVSGKLSRSISKPALDTKKEAKSITSPSTKPSNKPSATAGKKGIPKTSLKKKTAAPESTASAKGKPQVPAASTSKTDVFDKKMAASISEAAVVNIKETGVMAEQTGVDKKRIGSKAASTKKEDASSSKKEARKSSTQSPATTSKNKGAISKTTTIPTKKTKSPTKQVVSSKKNPVISNEPTAAPQPVRQLKDNASRSFSRTELMEVYETELLVKMIKDGVFPETIYCEIVGLPSHVDRIDKMYSYMKPFLTQHREDKEKKSDEESDKYREEGDYFYAQGAYEEAIKSYTISLAYAATKEKMALAYAKRSVILQEWKLLEECKSEIKKATDINIPVELRQELNQRLKDLKNIKSRNPKYHGEVPTISDNERNRKIYSAVNNVRMDVNRRYGKHLVATKNIDVGEIVLIEKPFVASAFNEEVIHCHDCCKLTYTAIPCDYCTSTVYCGEECKTNAYQQYHKYECVVKRKIDRPYLNDGAMLAMKLTYLARDHYLDIESLSNREKCYRSDRYNEIYKLQTHLKKTTNHCFLKWVYQGAYAYHILKTYTDFFDVPDREAFEKGFKELIIHNRGVTEHNAIIGMEMTNVYGEMFDHEGFGMGMYPAFNLLNHACFFNITTVYYGTTAVCYATHTIKKGEQLFRCYGPRFDVHPVALRKTILDFECKCLACVKDWDITSTRFRGGKNSYSLTVMNTQNLKNIRKNMLKVTIELRNAEKKFLPHEDYDAALMTFEYCLRMLANIKPGYETPKRK